MAGFVVTPTFLFFIFGRIVSVDLSFWFGFISVATSLQSLSRLENSPQSKIFAISTKRSSPCLLSY